MYMSEGDSGIAESLVSVTWAVRNSSSLARSDLKSTHLHVEQWARAECHSRARAIECVLFSYIIQRWSGSRGKGDRGQESPEKWPIAHFSLSLLTKKLGQILFDSAKIKTSNIFSTWTPRGQICLLCGLSCERERGITNTFLRLSWGGHPGSHTTGRYAFLCHLKHPVISLFGVMWIERKNTDFTVR